ncbi:kinesin motor domain-containing protein, partial [Pelagophyceae sp. CCMP2097]
MPLQRPGRHAHREARDYLFTKVFNGETAQQTVYDDATAPLVDALFEGRSALLFTYGVTNAGKSYTMMGKPEGDEAGIMPRALDAVLERANKEETSEVYVSFIEIYNEQIYDLMDK